MVEDNWRLAVDIGGTFTDVVLLNDSTGEVSVEKTLTTPKAVSYTHLTLPPKA